MCGSLDSPARSWCSPAPRSQNTSFCPGTAQRSFSLPVSLGSPGNWACRSPCGSVPSGLWGGWKSRRSDSLQPFAVELWRTDGGAFLGLPPGRHRNLPLPLLLPPRRLHCCLPPQRLDDRGVGMGSRPGPGRILETVNIPLSQRMK